MATGWVWGLLSILPGRQDRVQIPFLPLLLCVTPLIQPPVTVLCGPNSSAWPSSPTPHPAATCFSACPLILSYSFNQGSSLAPERPAFWPPYLFSGCVPHLECPLPLFIPNFRTLLRTAQAPSPLTWRAQSWIGLSPLNTQALLLASLVGWQEVGPDLPVLGSDMGEAEPLSGWGGGDLTHAVCFLKDPSSPDWCCWNSVCSVEGWRVGHRLPRTSQRGTSPSPSITHVFMSLSECSWCQASGCLRLNEIQGRPDTPSALW